MRAFGFHPKAQPSAVEELYPPNEADPDDKSGSMSPLDGEDEIRRPREAG
jgi:hypothetical protein